MSVNIAAAIQSQMLQALLQALQSADQPLKAGDKVEAKFMGWSDAAKPAAPTQGKPALAEALIQIGGKPTTLLITATPERRAQMQPGAMLTLQVDAAASEGAPAQMRLLTIQPPRDVTAGSAAQAPDAPVRQGLASSVRPGSVTAEAARAAAGPLIGAALGRQNGLGALYADLEILTRAPTQLPARVANAAMRAMAMRTDGATLDAQPDALKTAVASSGLLHEAMLAKAMPGEAGKDLKSALLTLKQALKEALGPILGDAKPALPAEALDKTDKPEPRASHLPAEMKSSTRPPAPTRDGLPVPQGAAQPSIDVGRDSVTTMMAKALERTEGALDRLSISQFASLPSTQELNQGAPLNRWFTELPLALDGRTAVLPMEIEEDHGGGSHSGAQAKLWRVRFALDVEPMGPVHAMVTMQGRAIGVTVWAERDATSQLVRDHAPDLKAALLDNDFDNPQIEVLAGQPMKRPAHAGHYLDRRS